MHQVDEDCQHARTITDPDTGEVFCENCGSMIPTEAVPIGEREIPATVFLRRVGIKRQKIERQLIHWQTVIRRLDAVDAGVRGVRCAWLGCDAAPMMRGRWCPEHKAEHTRLLAAERQRKRRERIENRASITLPHAKVLQGPPAS